MAWEEWEQLKSSASGQGSTHTQLNGPTSGGGGADSGPRGGTSSVKGGPNLVVNNDSLGALGNMAYDLRERIRVDADHARPATFDASIELFNDGLDMGSALTELHDAWTTKVTTLKDACARISNHLDYTKAQHNKDEAHVQGEVSSIAKLDKWMQKD